MLYASNTDRESIRAKIHDEKWAADSWIRLRASIDPYVQRHQQDPTWIISRLAMYWKDGERYTQCYLKGENWDRGEGNAPVPTVRLPGMRTWNDFINVPLEERPPYNETGDMLALSRKNPQAPAVKVPYKKSGHLIRANNNEILALAEKAAFVYWVTEDETYACFACDIFWIWTLGTYYMQPPLDPAQSTGGPGGYAPGGTAGYYDYEQIHDDLITHAAPVYDFLYDYLAAHPAEKLGALGLKFPEVAEVVFKRFVDIGFVRGGRTGNWNVNGWNVMMRGILVLGPNRAYADGHGREYYLEHYLSKSTSYHEALPEILKAYDEVTGLWPESPGYGLGTINSVLDLAIPIYRLGIDTIGDHPVMQKAALANFPWWDARGNMVIFGDTRGGPGSFLTFERLLTYYTWKGDEKNAAIMAAALNHGIASGQYDRISGWEGICVNVSKLPAGGELPPTRTAFSEAHRHVVLKNLNDQKNGLMLTLYGGTKGNHLSPNGLALQLYGKGWALAPDASAYESYWSKDVKYHQSAVGSNTIVPGYTEGPIKVYALEPTPAPHAFTEAQAISSALSFVDVGAGEKRRLASIVRTSPRTGFYVDIFRSEQPDNDYIYHNLGDRFSLLDEAEQPLTMTEIATLAPAPLVTYQFFEHPRRIAREGAFIARWTIALTTPSITMDMWMLGGGAREVYQVEAPPTTLNRSVVPKGVNLAPEKTPTLIVRQNGRSGWAFPFVAIFEPYEGDERAVRRVSSFGSGGSFVGVLVESGSSNPELTGRKDYILNAVDDGPYAPSSDIDFRGTYGVVSTNARGFIEMYLGRGRALRFGKEKIEAAGEASAGLVRRDGAFSYSSDSAVTLTLNYDVPIPREAYQKLRISYRVADHFVEAPGTSDPDTKTITAEVPAGYNVSLRILESAPPL